MKNILILTTLIFGLIFTSLIKNKTRSLEKKLAKLNNEIIILNSNLEEATLDLEYLTDEKNERITAFGHWAGYVGAALSLDIYLHQLNSNFSQI